MSAEAAPESKVLPGAIAVAFLIEAAALTAAGWHGHWLAHPPADQNPTDFVEAQIFEVPEEAHLREEKPVARAKSETVLSKKPDQGRKAKPDESKLEEQNQAESSPPLAPTHGPVAVFAPSPAIPPYLQEQNLKASVVIDFLVSALGKTEPRLVGSSGSQELDAIAIETARRWRFRPAENDHHPIDAKVRLRIVFEVHD